MRRTGHAAQDQNRRGLLRQTTLWGAAVATTAAGAAALYVPLINAVMRGERPVISSMQELDTTMQQRLVIGACSPYKGTKIPRPGSG